MRQKETKSTQAKHSTPGKTTRSTKRTDTSTDTNTTSDPPTISPMVRMQQQKVLAAVTILFEDITGQSYIKYLNWLLSDWLYQSHKAGNDPGVDVTSDMVYRIISLVNFMSKLQGLTDYTFDDILQGGSISREELLEGLL